MNRTSGSRKRGFTLLELLVVAAVAAVLAVLALPARARNDSGSKRFQCCNNLRQWTRALQMYAAENNDTLPRDGFGPIGVWPDGTLYNGQPSGTPADPNAWFNCLPPFLGSPGLAYYAQLPGSDPRTKFPFPGKTNAPSLWHCPAASMSDTDFALVSMGGANGFFSYEMNIDLKKQTASGNFAYPQMPKLTSLAKPAATVLFFDCAFNPRTEVFPFNSSPQFNSVNPAGRWRSFTARHVNGATMAFLDGQARFFALSYVTDTTTGNEPLRPDIIWNPPYRLANP